MILKKIQVRVTLLVVLLITIGLVLVWRFFSESKKEAEVDLLRQAPYLQKPSYTEPVYEKVSKINFSQDLLPPDLPQEMPVYKIEKSPITESEIDVIAKKLGFESQPIISNSVVGGKTYYYSGIGTSLRVLPNQRIIDYKTGNLPQELFSIDPTKEEFVPLAFTFLVNNSFITSQEELRFNKFRPLYTVPSGHSFTENSKSNLVSISFAKQIDAFPILGSTPETGALNIMFNNRREVVSVYLDDIPKLTEFAKYPIKNLEEIKESFFDTSLQSLNEGVTSEEYSGSVREVTVEKIETVYVQEYEGPQEFLQPTFLIQGAATFQNGKEVQAILYLPAIKYR